MNEILAAFGLYFTLLVVIGLLAYRKSTTAADFILGGRSLNFYVTALSAHASDMSSWLFMAYPALIFTGGGIQVWVAVGLVLGMWANWQFIAPRLRTETERTNSLTLSGYFATRFNDPSGLLRTVGGLLSLFFFTVYVSAGLVGMGFLFEGILGFDRYLGITATMIVVVIYTLVGGFTSICWVDLCQALFLMVMIVLVPCVALGHLNGTVSEALTLHNISPALIPSGNWKTLFEIILASFGWGLGYFGQIHILTKFMGIKNPSDLKKSKWVGLTWQVICLAAATAIGFVAIAYFPNGLANPEQAFVLMVKQLFHPFFAGIVLSAVFAATISTIDSQLLVLTSVLSEDFYHRFLRRNASAKETVWSSRISVIIVALVAYLIALFTGRNVLQLTFYAWSGLGSTFGPVLLLALWSKHINKVGALFGMVFGGIVAAFWEPLTASWPIETPALIPGFIGNIILILIVSKALKPK